MGKMDPKGTELVPKVRKLDPKVRKIEPKGTELEPKVGKRDPKGTEWDPKCPPRFSCTVQHEELPLPLSKSVYRNTGRGEWAKSGEK